MTWSPLLAISGRLLVPILFALAAMLAIGVSYQVQVREISDSLRYHEQKRLRERLGVEQTRLEHQKGLNNLLQVRRLVSALALHDGITHAWLIDKHGFVVAALSRTELGKPLQNVLSKQLPELIATIGQGYPHFQSDIHIHAIENDEAFLAEVGVHPDWLLLVRMDLRPALAERLTMGQHNLWRLAAMIILFSVFLAALLHLLWFRRAAQLTAIANALEAGNFAARANMTGHDELATIGAALDNMAASQQRYQNDLRQSLRNLETIANASPALFWMSGLDKGCNWFNQRWLDFTGRSMLQEQGNGWTEGVHLDDFERCLHIYDAAFDARQPFSMEYRLRRYDGEYRWLLDQGMPRYDADGDFLGFIGSCLDITSEKLLNEQLVVSEAHYRYLFVQNPAPMLIYQRTNWQLVSVNEAFLNHYGYSLSEVLMLRLPDLYPEPEKEAIVELAKNLHGQACSGEWHHRLKSGEFIDVLVHSNDLIYDNQACRVSVILDITSIKRAEWVLQQRNEELERFNAASIDRELAMIELKRQVNQLSIQLGHQAPFDLSFTNETSSKNELGKR